MNYLLKSNIRSRRPFLPVLVIVVLLAIFLSLYFLSPKLVGGPFRYIAFPFWKLRQISSDFFLKGILAFQSKESLSREIEKLKIKARASESSLELLDVYKNENEELKAILGRKKDEEKMVASILASPPVSPYDVLVIDVGSKNGVKRGMIVVVDETVVGEISETSGRTSKVRLFSSPEEHIDVVIGEKRIQAEADGAGGGNFRIVLPKGVEVSKGDAILLPGVFPRLIGVVGDISSSDADSFQTIYARSPVNFKESRFVEVTISPFEELNFFVH